MGGGGLKRAKNMPSSLGCTVITSRVVRKLRTKEINEATPEIEHDRAPCPQDQNKTSGTMSCVLSMKPPVLTDKGIPSL